MKKIDVDEVLISVYNNEHHPFYKDVRDWEKNNKHLTFWEMDALALYHGEGVRGFNKWCRVTGLHPSEYWEKREKIENILKGEKSCL